MCGFVGIFNEANESVISKMLQAVSHRGPDSSAVKITNKHSLGESRLVIVGDPNVPPIFYERNSGLYILFNGEIYNFKELRSYLEKRGDIFETDLEAEVIARLYLKEGDSFVKLLKGMFAIAIIDQNKLLLARDKVGIKPLYYYKINNKIVFASEIKGILKYPGLSISLNTLALEETFVFGYVYSSEITCFSHIYQVPPGYLISFTENKIQKQKYYSFPKVDYANSEYTDINQSAKVLKELIINSMDILFKHCAQDKAVYLSGGIDSSTISLVVKQILGYPIKTFTLSDDLENADYIAANKVAKILGTEHIEKIISINDYWDYLPHFIRHYESLMAGGVFDIQGGLAFHLLSKIVSEHVRVAFSGEGADEIFGGYYWIYTHPLGFSDRIKSRLNKLPYNSHLQKLINELFPHPEDELMYRKNVLNALLHGGLFNYHLQSVDRSAGSFGFEIRPIYLYDDLAEYVLRLPVEFKVPDKIYTKMVFRKAFAEDFEKLGMNWVLTRQKEGMPSAVRHLDKLVKKFIDLNIADNILESHPYKMYLSSKMDLFLFDLFYLTFIKNQGDLEKIEPLDFIQKYVQKNSLY